MQHPSAPGAERERRDVVVIGASAGGVETLLRVVSGLPPDLAASVCIVLHLAPGSPSALPAILQRRCRLPCRAAVDGEPLREGEILVAPPDRHLTIEDGHVSLTAGPRENGHRPSIDALFRSAALAQDGKVVGVVLSGTRDDGTAGLAVIKAEGGLAIVQDPAEAMYPGMPASAIASVAVDTIVTSDHVAQAIVDAVSDPPAELIVDRDPAGAGGNPGLGANPGMGGNPGHGANRGTGREPAHDANPGHGTNPGHGSDPGQGADRGAAAPATHIQAGVTQAGEAGAQGAIVRTALGRAAQTTLRTLAGGEQVESERRGLR